MSTRALPWFLVLVCARAIGSTIFVQANVSLHNGSVSTAPSLRRPAAVEAGLQQSNYTGSQTHTTTSQWVGSSFDITVNGCRCLAKWAVKDDTYVHCLAQSPLPPPLLPISPACLQCENWTNTSIYKRQTDACRTIVGTTCIVCARALSFLPLACVLSCCARVCDLDCL